MTYLHFLNCIALTFGPLVLAYRGSPLSQSNGYFALFSCFFINLFIQILKLFMLAQLPTVLFSATNEYSFILEISKIFLDTVLHSFGIVLCFKKARNINRLISPSPSLKILCVGLGWSLGHSITHYAIPIWSARLLEYSNKYSLMAIRSNLHLISTIALSALIFNDYHKSRNNLVLNEKLKKGKKKKGKNKNIGNGGNKGSQSWWKKSSYVLSTDLYLVLILVSSVPSVSNFALKILLFEDWMCIGFEIIAAIVISCVAYFAVGKKFKNE